VTGESTRPGGLTTHQVWDGPTRLYHWTNAVTICGSMLTGWVFVYVLIEGTPKVVMEGYRAFHLAFGYLFFGLLIARCVWGFVGNRFARWSAVLPTRHTFAAVPFEVAAVFRGYPHEYLGRSPLSRISNTVMFALFLVQAASGLGREWTDFYYPFATIHHYNAYLLTTVILVHICGAVLSEVMQRSGVVSAMLSGTKVMSGAPIDAESGD